MYPAARPKMPQPKDSCGREPRERISSSTAMELSQRRVKKSRSSFVRLGGCAL